MSDNNEFKVELGKIRALRKDVYKLDTPILCALGLAVLSQFTFPIIAPLFGFVAFFIFYKKMANAAHYPCPKCQAGFGSSSNVVHGVGGDSCQNCGLNLNPKNKWSL